MNNIVVVKCGGSTITELTESFFESIVQLKNAGKHPIIVHGGGPAINKMLTQLQIPSTFIDGLRKTTEEVLETAEMVLCGKMNKQLTRKLQSVGAKAIGLSGTDGKLIVAEAIDKEKLGFVGEPVQINKKLLLSLLDSDFIPVIAPIGVDQSGQHYNINADSAAAIIAAELKAEELVFVTDVDGILKDKHLLPTITAEEIALYINDGTIYGGMIPKVKAALKSLTGSLQSVWIMNGKGTSLFANGTIYGTKITKKQVATTAT
ncbi:acetylglutamate kinase [Alkalihalobacillus alcalophilus ATCC 27647 = CGMCC 1.3604]|uniref:Acetylglutamate kinase n=1 Tax=Alkalihalobacillus alcalophilus ATCC 27647 = CGMCC 1.3604 TaxID=1218173 RepID=A0A094WN36_ALKAL|nr:acetylglutamate kinase [Alkalihalobacillus alcalophilus]KGA97383.1 acetylglutamate kinase [Alkalihalobacillus alcalophilus ATCC 27647 = CGMCC 1.3604]MED1560550.1 acetylglutamate kinase [Alkalihalobacillus alcalophilus]THG89157.1 acetylglutamate kinase [Alkalihalobacillus alcalophilus ATCC 27647 = CGMCC 1.3604]